jgi:Tfp pilus assembly protein PilF
VDSAGVTLHSTGMTGNKSDEMNLAALEAHAVGLEQEHRLEEARAAYDAALQVSQTSQAACEGRARIALQLREDDAAEHCARALAFRNDDPDLQAQMIITAASEIGRDAIPLLREFLDRHPQHILAQEVLADLQAQAGAGDGFLDAYVAALAKQPDSKPLLMSYWEILARSGRFAAAIESMDVRRHLFEGDRNFAILEINIASHSGLVERAGKLLESMDFQLDAQLARGLNRLQAGAPDEAASLLDGVVAVQPDNFEAWSLLEVAWRMTGDDRHGWLVGQPPLYGARDLDLGSAQLADIATMLRGMHQASAQPIGQSVRGGTQTPGQLFDRSAPEMATLTAALTFEIRQFVNDLPPADPRHPLLKHRNSGMAFGPSWSVRFTGSGHHAAHFHPGGILSSACYICVPDTLADDAEKPGWLEIGRPPAELGLDLPPLATFEPKPGRLVLFPSFLFHGTRPFSGGERLSVAFDLVPVPMR